MRQIRHVLPFITRSHRLMFRLTGGRIGSRALGFRFLVLHHVGRKSGVERETPLLFVEDRGRILVVASNAGQDHHPAWWLNLRERPDTRVRIGTDTIAVRARRAEGDEAERLWGVVNESWKWFDDYRAGTSRDIPILVLEPRPGEDGGASRAWMDGRIVTSRSADVAGRRRVEVERVYDAAPDAVWASLTDHARLGEVGMPGARLVREGHPDRNGVGAIRAFPGVREEVLEFEPPKRMTYTIVAGFPVIRDHLGELCLEPSGAGTLAVWRCEFDSRVPGLGGLVARGIGKTFARVLARADARGFPSQPG